MGRFRVTVDSPSLLVESVRMFQSRVDEAKGSFVSFRSLGLFVISKVFVVVSPWSFFSFLSFCLWSQIFCFCLSVSCFCQLFYLSCHMVFSLVFLRLNVHHS